MDSYKRKFISCIIGGLTALTVFGTASVSANVMNNAGNAAQDVIEGAGEAVGDVANGAGNAVNEVFGANTENTDAATDEVTAEATVATTEAATTTAATTTTTTSATTTVAGATNETPKTGSLEIVTFGALALGSLAVAATTSRRRK